MTDPWTEEAGVTICFTGHRVIGEAFLQEIRSRLDEAISHAYSEGYRNFVCGGALGFDTLAAQSVLAFRNEYPDVRLMIAVPCSDQDINWNRNDRNTYRKILAAADSVIVLSDKYFPGCMQIRNRYMVEHSSMCIAWLTRLNGSGTLNTVKYALSKNLIIRNLAITGKK